MHRHVYRRVYRHAPNLQILVHVAGPVDVLLDMRLDMLLDVCLDKLLGMRSDMF